MSPAATLEKAAGKQIKVAGGATSEGCGLVCLDCVVCNHVLCGNTLSCPLPCASCVWQLYANYDSFGKRAPSMCTLLLCPHFPPPCCPKCSRHSWYPKYMWTWAQVLGTRDMSSSQSRLLEAHILSQTASLWVSKGERNASSPASGEWFWPLICQS